MSDAPRKPIVNLDELELLPRPAAFAATGDAASRFDARVAMIGPRLGAQKLGYNSPADLVECYPDFYWKRISPHLSEAFAYLNVTTAGRLWIANLHSHVFCVEHSLALMGPER